MRIADGGDQREEDRKSRFPFQVITSHYQPGLLTKRLQTCVEGGHKPVSTYFCCLFAVVDTDEGKKKRALTPQNKTTQVTEGKNLI